LVSAICFSRSSTWPSSAGGAEEGGGGAEGETKGGEEGAGAITPVSTRWSFWLDKNTQMPISKKQEVKSKKQECASQVGYNKQ
jgi:hypothetical protein